MMNQNDLKQMFGSTPESFRARIGQTLGSAHAPRKARGLGRRGVRTALAVALALTAFSAAAAAAFSSQVADFFGAKYGHVLEEELRAGDITARAQSIALGDAVYTLNEVVYAQGGLYGIGDIRPASDAVVLMAEDYLVTDAAGYGLFFGEESRAPDGAPSYAEVAAEKGAKLLLVQAVPDAVGVDGGDILVLPTVGYEMRPQADGSIQFAFQLPAGPEVAKGDTYAIRIWISNWEVTPEGEWLREGEQDTYLGQEWTVEIAPRPSGEKEEP